jgi:hypothetical protein
LSNPIGVNFEVGPIPRESYICSRNKFKACDPWNCRVIVVWELVSCDGSVRGIELISFCLKVYDIRGFVSENIYKWGSRINLKINAFQVISRGKEIEEHLPCVKIYQMRPNWGGPNSFNARSILVSRPNPIQRYPLLIAWRRPMVFPQVVVDSIFILIKLHKYRPVAPAKREETHTGDLISRWLDMGEHLNVE